ncbi:hypothetical protein DPMN_149150 [Dreissena polymorpha]|uniref:MULE transposase domain-containing protein n=1 Tax=Dreissena polymorpha TaxID=45954 RepID=A0A9D4FB76_DREPO|nr:hypothetical protein DPMN_149150 [Dreissena polymorpha]
MAETWLCDGIYSTAPKQFAQLFCICVPLGDGNVTAAYALITCKQQELYEEVFTAVLDACLQRDIRPNIRVVVCDYEQAIHNAVRTSLSSHTSIQACFYQLTQATWRRVQSDALQTRYRDEEEVWGIQERNERWSPALQAHAAALSACGMERLLGYRTWYSTDE